MTETEPAKLHEYAKHIEHNITPLDARKVA